MTENLWPDFTTEPRPRTVRTVLLEAAQGLQERTDGKLKLGVYTLPAGKARFQHSCVLEATSLQYKYPLCTVTEEGDPYPVSLVGDATFLKGASAGNEAALKENLRLLFGSDSTKRIVTQLLELGA